MSVVKVIGRGGDTSGLRDGFDWVRSGTETEIVLNVNDTHGGIITRKPLLAG